MKSGRFNVAICGLLGIVLLATLLSWIVSFRHPHSLVWGRWGQYGILVERGMLEFRRARWTNLAIDATGKLCTVEVTPETVDFKKFSLPPKAVLVSNIQLSPWRPFSTGWMGLGGFAKRDGRELQFGSSVDAWGVAFWVLALPLTALFAWRVLTEYRARRLGGGCCTVCGYDLRASPERCPECGTVGAK